MNYPPQEEDPFGLARKKRDEDLGRLRLSLDAAKEFKPEDFAKAMDVGEKVDLPADIAARILKEKGFDFDPQDPTDQELDEFRRRAPRSSFFAMDPVNATLVRRELKKLAELEQEWDYLGGILRPFTATEEDRIIEDAANELAGPRLEERLAAPQHPIGVMLPPPDRMFAARQPTFEEMKEEIRQEWKARLKNHAAFVGARGKIGFGEAAMDRLRENPLAVVPILADVFDMNEALTLKAASDAFDVSRATEHQKNLLILAARKIRAAEARGYTIGGQAGNIVINLPAFAGGFALTGGAYAGVSTAVKGGASIAFKSLLRNRITGFVAGVAAQTLAKDIPAIAAGVIERMTTGVDVDVNDAGELIAVLGQKGDDFFAALAKSAGDRFIENVSERSGFLVSDLVPMLKAAAMKRWLKAPAKAGEPARTVKTFLARVKDATGWHGVLGEMFEERVGEFMRGATGLEPFRLPSWEQLAAEALGFAVPGGAFFAAGVLERKFGRGDIAKAEAAYAGATADGMKKILHAAHELQLAQLSSAKIGELIQAQTQDTDKSTLLVTAEEFVTRFQGSTDDLGKPIDEAKLADSLTGKTGALDEALRLKTHLQIPMSRLVEATIEAEEKSSIKKHEDFFIDQGTLDPLVRSKKQADEHVKKVVDEERVRAEAAKEEASKNAPIGDAEVIELEQLQPASAGVSYAARLKQGLEALKRGDFEAAMKTVVDLKQMAQATEEPAAEPAPEMGRLEATLGKKTEDPGRVEGQAIPIPGEALPAAEAAPKAKPAEQTPEQKAKAARFKELHDKAVKTLEGKQRAIPGRTSFQRVQEDVARQLKAAGDIEDVAETKAFIFASGIYAFAHREGIDPWDLYTERAFTVRRPELEEAAGPGERVHEAKGFHGTPRKFTRFSLHKVGTGVGRQAFAWGLNFSSSKAIARYYRDFLVDVDEAAVPGDLRFDAEAGQYVATNDYGRERRFKSEQDAFKWLAQGFIYKVDLPDRGGLLDFEKQISAQSDKIQKALAPILKDFPDLNKEGATGESFYLGLAGVLGGAEQASKKLAAAGIPGITHIDEFSRSRGKGPTNFVIFDDKVIKILQVERHRELQQPGKYSGSEAKRRNAFARAKKEFGTTQSFLKAGYLLPDGTLLNFAGTSEYGRTLDHREIKRVVKADKKIAADLGVGTSVPEGEDAEMRTFMSYGAIRISPETPGIEIGPVEPTEAQQRQIAQFIKESQDRPRSFVASVVDSAGDYVYDQGYGIAVSANEVLTDIAQVFGGGRTLNQPTAFDPNRGPWLIRRSRADSEEMTVIPVHYATRTQAEDVARQARDLGLKAEVFKDPDYVPPPFYSKLVNLIEAKMNPVATIVEVRGIAREIRADEKLWMGFDAFLDEAEREGQKKIKKSELLNYMAANALVIEEVETGRPPFVKPGTAVIPAPKPPEEPKDPRDLLTDEQKEDLVNIEGEEPTSEYDQDEVWQEAEYLYKKALEAEIDAIEAESFSVEAYNTQTDRLIEDADLPDEPVDVDNLTEAEAEAWENIKWRIVRDEDGEVERDDFDSKEEAESKISDYEESSIDNQREFVADNFKENNEVENFVEEAEENVEPNVEDGAPRVWVEEEMERLAERAVDRELNNLDPAVEAGTFDIESYDTRTGFAKHRAEFDSAGEADDFMRWRVLHIGGEDLLEGETDRPHDRTRQGILPPGAGAGHMGVVEDDLLHRDTALAKAEMLNDTYPDQVMEERRTAIAEENIPEDFREEAWNIARRKWTAPRRRPQMREEPAVRRLGIAADSYRLSQGRRPAELLMFVPREPNIIAKAKWDAVTGLDNQVTLWKSDDGGTISFDSVSGRYGLEGVFAPQPRHFDTHTAAVAAWEDYKQRLQKREPPTHYGSVVPGSKRHLAWVRFDDYEIEVADVDVAVQYPWRLYSYQAGGKLKWSVDVVAPNVEVARQAPVMIFDSKEEAEAFIEQTPVFTSKEKKKERVLFIQELQSDWLQKGARLGLIPEYAGLLKKSTDLNEARNALQRKVQLKADMLKSQYGQFWDLAINQAVIYEDTPAKDAAPKVAQFILSQFGERKVFVNYFEEAEGDHPWAVVSLPAFLEGKASQYRGNIVAAFNTKAEAEDFMNVLMHDKGQGVVPGGQGMPVAQEVQKYLNDFMELSDELDDAMEDAEVAEVGLDQLLPVPPFRDAWEELIMKRMVRYAAEQGYDRIAWTTPHQQMERWSQDFRSKVSKITWQPWERGRRKVKVWKDGQELTTLTISKRGRVLEHAQLKTATVQAVFGPSVGDQIMAATEGTVEGEGLSIGGELFVNIYGRRIPKAMNKLGKPYGAQVKDIGINTGETGFTPEQKLARAQADLSLREAIDYNRTKFINAGYLDRNVEEMKQAPTAYYSALKTAIPDEHDAWLKATAAAPIPVPTMVPSLQITPELRAAAEAGLNLFQPGKTGTRGQIKIGPATIKIELLADADLSTFLHEVGHFYLDLMASLAGREAASAGIKADLATILDYVGVKTYAEVTDDMHEKIARTFETYLMHGHAPTPALQNAFSKLKAWLTWVYRMVKDYFQGVKLSKEVRGVFDRMLAVEAEIAAARNQLDFQAALKDPAIIEKLGISPDEVTAYTEAVDRFPQEAERELQAVMMRQTRREQMAWYEDERAQVEEDVAAQVNSQPRFMAAAWFRSGTWPSGDPLPAGSNPRRLQKQNVDAKFPGRSKNPKLALMFTTQDGIDPEAAATQFGFSSADEMLTAIETSPNRKAEIERITDERMKELYPDDPMTDGTMSEEVMKAMHNESRGDLLMFEIRAYARKTGRRTSPLEVVKEAARNAVAGKSYRELTPNVYLTAEKKAARESYEAAATGNFEAALEAKERELLNHEFYRASLQAREHIEEMRSRLARFDTDAVRRRIAKAGGGHLDQIDSILERYEFRRGVSAREAAKRQGLVEWYEAKKEAGMPPTLSPAVIDEARRQNYKDVSYDELIGIHDSLLNIEHLAGLKNTLLANKAHRELEDAALKAEDSINANGPPKRPFVLGRPPAAEAGRTVAQMFAMQRKLSSLCWELDGFKPGIMFDLIVRGAKTAGAKEALMMEEDFRKLTDIFSQYTTLKEITAFWTRHHIPEIGTSISKAEELMIALNWGNEGNRERLKAGYGWNDIQVQAVLDRLTDRDLKFVQKVLDLIETKWPAIKALSERADGLAPEKVEAVPIVCKAGTIPGGYFPVKAEPRLSKQTRVQEAVELAKATMRGAAVRAQTKHGHREERAAMSTRKLRLDIGVIFEHISAVNHDLTHYEYVLDANRVLRHGKVEGAIKERYGDIYYDEMILAINDIATGLQPATNAFERILNSLRRGRSVAILGFRLSTAMLQPFGITQSIVRLGPKWVARGFASWMGDAKRMEGALAWIRAKSEFMRTRGTTMTREIEELRNQVRLTGKTLSKIEAYSMVMTVKMQLFADIPTWIGAYEKALEEAGQPTSDQERQEFEDRAIDIADQTVLDTQGGGQTKDLARVQRVWWLKIFTQFMTFFSARYNLMAESVARTRLKPTPENIGKLAMDFLMLYSVPMAVTVIIRGALRGGDDDDDLTAKLFKAQVAEPLGDIVFIRELVGPVMGYDYRGPSGVSAFEVFGRLAKQISQGEADDAFWRALMESAGTVFHLPSGQVDATLRGLEAFNEDEAGPGAILIGPPPKRR